MVEVNILLNYKLFSVLLQSNLREVKAKTAPAPYSGKGGVMAEIFMGTNNAHKRDELQAMLGLQFRLPSEAGLAFDPEEDAASYFGNAFIKARELYELTGSPVVSDDSGLEVEALPYSLGVHTARFGGADLSQSQRNALLLEKMAGIENRAACFVCCLVYYKNSHVFYAVQEVWTGRIADRLLAGAGGFGYDPLFIPEGFAASAAQLSAGEKNRISHRALAAQKLKKILD